MLISTAVFIGGTTYLAYEGYVVFRKIKDINRHIKRMDNYLKFSKLSTSLDEVMIAVEQDKKDNPHIYIKDPVKLPSLFVR